MTNPVVIYKKEKDSYLHRHPDLPQIPSAALRSANLRILGSGQRSVTAAGYLAAFPALIDCIASGTLRIPTQSYPLSEVEQVWTAPVDPQKRIVFVPA